MKKINKLFAALIIAGLSFVSCKNNFIDYSDEYENTNENTNEKAYLSFAINEGEERKISPVELTWAEVDSIELTKDNAVLKTWKTTAEKNAYAQMKADDSVLLDAGTYDFAITLKDAENYILQTGKLEGVEIKAGANPLNFKTRPYMDGTGKLTIDCSKNTSLSIESIDYSIKQIGGEENKIGSFEENSKKCTIPELPCGDYLVCVTINLLNSTSFPKKITELVEIQNKRETVYNCCYSEEKTPLPVVYYLENGTQVTFEEGYNVSYYAEPGQPLPDENKIIASQKPEGQVFFGWYDDKDDLVVTYPKKDGKVILYAKFGKVVNSADDLDSGIKNYIVKATDDNFVEIYTKLNSDYKSQDYSIKLDLTGISKINIITGECYAGWESLKEITIPAGVKTIGAKAFYYCTKLTKVTFAEGSQLTSIKNSTFYNCSKLKTVKFEEGSNLSSIEQLAFFGCSSLTEITIPAGVKKINTDTFNSCSGLKTVTFAQGSQLESIEDTAFKSCSSLTEITIPAGVTSIGSEAFNLCSSLKTVTFAEGSQLKNIGTQAFNCCSSLTEIAIPSNVTSIGDSAFNVCSSLLKVTIPASVTSIGSKAFQACFKLSTVTFEDISKLTSIGDNAFNSCSSLVPFEIPTGVIQGDGIFIGCKTN